MKQILLGLLLSVCSLSSYAQEPIDHSKYEIGIDVQWYPAGWLLGPIVQFHPKPHHVFITKLGINLANRHDWSGLNDDEKGVGFGGTLGYRYYFKPQMNTFFIGTRGELYNTYIEWKNDIGRSIETNGRTQIFVYQPSFELGYWFKVPNSPWCFTLSGGAGVEINLLTKGKPVGEGGMWLATFSLLRAIK